MDSFVSTEDEQIANAVNRTSIPYRDRLSLPPSTLDCRQSVGQSCLTTSGPFTWLLTGPSCPASTSMWGKGVPGSLVGDGRTTPLIATDHPTCFDQRPTADLACARAPRQRGLPPRFTVLANLPQRRAVLLGLAHDVRTLSNAKDRHLGSSVSAPYLARVDERLVGQPRGPLAIDPSFGGGSLFGSLVFNG